MGSVSAHDPEVRLEVWRARVLGEASNTSRRPLGEYDGTSWMPLPEVMTFTSLPVRRIVAICSLPLRWKMSNAMRRPSGRQSEESPGR